MPSMLAVNGDYWTGPDGVVYPVTGYWCNVCGLPRVPLDGMTYHPTCTPLQHQGGEGRGRQDHSPRRAA